MATREEARNHGQNDRPGSDSCQGQAQAGADHRVRLLDGARGRGSVPQKVAAEITKRVDILTFSMGSGPDCDGQFLFACDLLGTNHGHYPRHAKTYCKLLDQATKALAQYASEVRSGAYPEPKHCIGMQDKEYDRFLEAANRRGRQ